MLQPLRWCCVDCVIHHERDAREEQKYVCVEQASNNKRDCEHELYCCLLLRCGSFAHMPLGLSDRNSNNLLRVAGYQLDSPTRYQISLSAHCR